MKIGFFAVGIGATVIENIRIGDGAFVGMGAVIVNGVFIVCHSVVGLMTCHASFLPTRTGIVLVEMAEGKTFRYTRGPLRVTGRLSLNATDPERFLFLVGDAQAIEGE